MNNNIKEGTMTDHDDDGVTWIPIVPVPQKRYVGRGIMPHAQNSEHFTKHHNQWNPANLVTEHFQHSNTKNRTSSRFHQPAVRNNNNNNNNNNHPNHQRRPRNSVNQNRMCSNMNLQYSNLSSKISSNPVKRSGLRQKEIDKLEEEEKKEKEIQEAIMLMNRYHESDELPEPQKHYNVHNHKREYPCFSEIIPKVREVTGGRNVTSNEAIEQRHRERVQAHENSNALNQSSNSESYQTISSNDSFKTAYSFEEMTAIQQKINQKIQNESNIDRYKNNAVIMGLLGTVKNNKYVEDEELYNSKDEEDWADATSNPTSSKKNVSTVEINANIQSLKLEGAEGEIDEDTLMRSERLGRFLYQSREDEDVYVHPLREQIQNNPDWQQSRLSRKGIQTIFTPREYYMNLDDENFNFMPPKVSK